MQLELMTWPVVDEHVRKTPHIIIPIGSTEQHGPTGLIGTDTICASAIARGVGETTGALVGPVVNVGMAQHHTAFAGSITLRPSTLLRLVTDYLTSLAEHGITHFFFINGHGGNAATLNAAFSEFYLLSARSGLATAADLRCELVNWWQYPQVSDLARKLFGNDEGAHATPSEVALTQYCYPATAAKGSLEKRTGEACIIYGRENFRARYPDGRIGSDPDLATPEFGQQLYAQATEAISSAYRKFIETD